MKNIVKLIATSIIEMSFLVMLFGFAIFLLIVFGG
jgi:hypothetical protein